MIASMRSRWASLSRADSAYYLVHSMSVGADFAKVDRHAAANFGRAAARAGVRRIIYLGGLADQAGSLSSHLQSRAETGSVLRASGVPVIEFRASIVVGAGSLSFQMIEALVERLPVMVCPRWVATLTQPMAVDDVVAYLVAALELPETGSEVFEIAGPDVVSYGDVMREYAAAPRVAPLAAAGAVVDAAPVGSLARTGDTGAGPCRPRAGGRVEEPDGGQIVRSTRRVPDRTDAVARGAGEGDRGRRSGASEGRHADHCCRRAPLAGLCADQANWRNPRLVLRELPLASARLAGPRVRRRGHEPRPSRSRELRADRGATGLVGRGLIPRLQPDGHAVVRVGAIAGARSRLRRGL